MNKRKCKFLSVTKSLRESEGMRAIRGAELFQGHSTNVTEKGF